MSNIESNIVDPRGDRPSPDVVPVIDDPGADNVGSGEIDEPGADIPPIEPDPEEGGRRAPDIDRAEPAVGAT
ncbi:hypothetical protein [Aureimonas glaciei]|uniref:Uncharacterized protein n=1 Tax=Aureimonas glaciei TaxID=1776957 RepID=A0A916YGX9_9HYPH|nr:hypothetical protein [Aureimonas glaciei]GGD42991.1 hypothetical protein GCM10011335_52060 [Aureimonas glaciei]